MQDLTKLSNTELLAQVKSLTSLSREIETQMIASSSPARMPRGIAAAQSTWRR